MIKALTVAILQEIARIRLGKKVRKGQGTRVNYRGIRIREGCLVTIGSDGLVEGKITFDRQGGSVRIGDRSFIGGGTLLICSTNISIGDDVLISWGCTITDHDSHSLFAAKRKDDVLNWARGVKCWSDVKWAPVSIERKSWVGFNSIILKGITVGEGAVIGAGTVVTQDVSPWTVVAGNPARVIREISEEER